MNQTGSTWLSSLICSVRAATQSNAVYHRYGHSFTVVGGKGLL